MTEREAGEPGLDWQIGIWDRISDLYLDDIDRRFVPVVDGVMARAGLRPGDRVLDLGTGTGSVALRAAAAVGPGGSVVGLDISPDMLAIATRQAEGLDLDNIEFRVGRAEEIPAEDSVYDAVLASLSLMYVIDRGAAAREIARVLRPGGRLVAAVWAGPDECDIVKFQATAGSFAPPPPVPGVGPGSMADPAQFISQLSQSSIEAKVEQETLGFDFDDFRTAWEVLAGVTTAQLALETRHEAQRAVSKLMWPAGDSPRHFRNLTQFIVGTT